MLRAHSNQNSLMGRVENIRKQQKKLDQIKHCDMNDVKCNAITLNSTVILCSMHFHRLYIETYYV